MRKFTFLLPLLLVLAFGSCSRWFKFLDSTVISANSLKKEMKTSKDLVVINVLPASSYKNCHIKGSINVEEGALKDEVSNWEKNKNIVVYSKSPTSDLTEKAYNKLKELGFKNVRKYEGGLIEWTEKKFPVEGPCKDL